MMHRFTVFGSDAQNCDDSTVLLDVEDAAFEEKAQFMSWEIPFENQKEFACIGFVFHSKIDAGSGMGVAATSISMWENI